MKYFTPVLSLFFVSVPFYGSAGGVSAVSGTGWISLLSGFAAAALLAVFLRCRRREGILRRECLSLREENRRLGEVQDRRAKTLERLSALFETAGLVVWEWEVSGGRFRFDRTGLETSGRLCGKQGGTLEEYLRRVHDDDRDRVRESFDALTTGSSARFCNGFRMRNSEGTYDWIEIYANAVGDKNPPVAVIGLMFLSTPWKERETGLEAARQYAEESNRRKSAFWADMSREMQASLNAIAGFSEMLVSTTDDGKRREYARFVTDNAELLLQSIEDILELLKIETGMQEFVYTDFDLNLLMRELERTAAMRAVSSEVRVVFEPGLPACSLRSEKTRLEQVIWNVLVNALRFTEKGTVCFGYRVEDEGKTLRFEVAGTGCGIPADRPGAVSGRFFSPDGSAAGAGFGLAICETVVRKLGGSIGVESSEGKGGTFWFTLPYEPAVVPSSTREAAETDVLPEILIAEDTDSNYKLFESILKKQYRIVRAVNGRQAVELFGERHPALILMDINMPELDGYGAVREIRASSSEVPIIAVTAYAFGSDEQRIMQSGFDAYLAKPVNVSVLKDTVRSFLGA